MVGVRGRFLAVLMLASGLAALAARAADDEPAPDPLPIRRVLIAPDKLEAILNKEKTLVSLSRKEFEERVERARAASDKFKNPPRLLEAHYRAQLLNHDLVGVTTGDKPAGEWKIINPHTSPGVLPLDPLNLAIRAVRLPSKAVLGDLDGKSLGFLVEQPGEQAVHFDWSARGSASPGVLRFDIQAPPCPVATLELDLPADRIVLPRETFLVSGPHPGASSERRLWHIDFTSQIQLEIRQGSGPQQARPLLLAKLKERQDLEPNLVRAIFEFELEAPHLGVKQIAFDVDPGLVPYEVDVRNLDSWEMKAGKLLVNLRKPFQEGTLSLPIEVRCLAALPADRKWTCPGMRLQGALERGASLVLRVHPDVQLEDWDAGNFQFVPPLASDVRPGPDWQVFRLQNVGVFSGAKPRRPSARLMQRLPAFQVKQQTWWQVAPGETTLSSRIDYTVLHGQLFRLVVGIPVGWNVDRVEVEPPDLLRSHTVLREAGKARLLVDLKRPLAPGGKPAQLQLGLKPLVWNVPPFGAALAIPDLEPLDAHLREGVLGISVDSAYRAEAQSSLPPGGLNVEGAWGNVPPEFAYSYRGLPVTGTLTLTPRRARLEARCKTTVSLQPARGELAAEVRLQPRIGQPRTIDLCVSAASAGDWRWRLEGPNQLRQVRRLRTREAAPLLAYLGAAHPLEAAALTAAPPPATEWWRFVLAEPLREAVVLQGAQAFAVQERDGLLHWAVPLVGVEQADPLEGEVILHLDGVAAAPLVRRGLWEGPGGGKTAASPWHAYRYSQPEVALEFAGKISDQVPDTTAGPFVEDAELTTTVDPAGRLLNHLRFRIWNWRQRTLPVVLPAGARCVAAVADESWIEHVPPPTHTADGVQIEIPIAGPAVHEIEIVYEVNTPAWKVWYKVEAPLPRLPARLLSLRRIWRLPPGMTPLVRERYEQLPDVVGRDASTLFNRPYPTPKDSLERLGSFTGWWNLRSDSGRVHPDDLAEACAAVARVQAPGRPWTLGESLTRVLEQMPVRQSLVVDALELRRREFSPSAPLFPSKREAAGTPPQQLAAWTEQGLVCVPGGPAFVLTTKQQYDEWLRAAGSSDGIAAALTAAVNAAVRHGHDSSGRFRSVPDWLRGDHETGVRSGNGQGLERFDFGSNWIEWEPRADHLQASSLTVVRRDLFPTLGLVVAALLSWVAWRSRRWSRALRSSLLWCWIAAGGVALLWLPEAAARLAWYPLVVGLVVVLIGYLRTATRSARAGAAGAALAALAVLQPALHSQLANQVYVVYLLPAEDSAPEKQTVEAPPELLERLDKLAARTPLGSRGAVLVAASYIGKVTDNIAALDARFQVHCFAGDKANVIIPLGSATAEGKVNLVEALLDGQKVAPAPLKQGGFSLELPSGRHEIVMRIQANVQATGADRALGFPIPELAESRVELEVPAGARSLYAALGRGRQIVNPEIAQEAPADKPLRLEADLGRIRSLQVRWRDDARPQNGVVDVQESYLWRLNPASSNLFAVLQFRVKQGAATRFACELPELLEVRSVEAASLPGAAATETLPRLVDWQIENKDGARQLTIGFQHPITSGVQIGVELVPRGALGPNLTLPLPRPLQARQSDGYVAYRADGLDVRHVDSQRVTGLLPERFAEVWKATGMPDPGPQIFAFTFDRVKGPPVVRVELSVAGATVSAAQDLEWRVGPRQADLTLTARIDSSERGLFLLEWDVPETVRGVEVSGADVRSWSRSGGRLQVWLQRPVPSTRLTLTGWQALEEVRKKAKQPEHPQLRLQALRLRNIGNQTSYVRFRAEPGLSLQPEQVKGLLPVPALDASPRELSYLERGDYTATMVAAPAPVRADVSALGFVELVEDELVYHALIDCRVHRAERRTLMIALRNWEGGNVRLEVPAGVAERRGVAAGGGIVWTVTLPEEGAGLYRLKLVGNVPLKKMGPISMPDVSVAGATGLERFVAVAGRELRVENPLGLDPLVDTRQALAAWPAEAERIRRAGNAWKIDAADWRLVLVPTRPTLATPFRVYLHEQGSALLDGQHWLHQATYWLHHETGADLAVELPAAARLLSVTVDGAEVTRIQSAPDKLWLPLATRNGAFVLRLCWSYPAEAEPLTRPRLDRPRLEGAEPALTLWTCHVPVGFALHAGQGQDEDSTLALRRCEAMLELSATLAAAAAGSDRDQQLRLAQVSFYRNLRRAEQALGSHHERVKQARERGLEQARTGNYEPLRERAEQEARQVRGDGERREQLGIAPLLAERGTPVSFAAVEAADTPRPTIVSLQSQRTRRNFELTVLFLVLLGTLVGVGLFPAALAWQRRLWPEQLIALGCMGWLALGPGWLFVFLVVLGGCGRLVLILTGIGRLLQRVAPLPNWIK